MVDAEDLWSDIVDINNPNKVNDLANKEDGWTLGASDYTDMGEEDEDSDEELDNWEAGNEDFEKEMDRMSKIE